MIGRFKNRREVLTDGLPNKATNQALVMNEALTYQVAIRHLEGGNKGDKLRQDKKKRKLGALGLGVDRLIQ